MKFANLMLIIGRVFQAISDDAAPGFNPGQLEACDNVLDEDSRLVAIDSLSKTITREVS